MEGWNLDSNVCLPKFFFNHRTSIISSHFFHHLDVLLCRRSHPTPLFFVLVFRGVRVKSSMRLTVPLSRMCERRHNDRKFPFVFTDLLPLLLYSLFPKMSSFISQDSLQQTKATDSSWQPVLPPPRSLSLLSNFSQTYQQSSSLQSKNRKKNKGKQENHLFSCTPCDCVSRNCYHSHMLSSCVHSLPHLLGDADLMRAARIMRAYVASVEPSILITLCVCNLLISWKVSQKNCVLSCLLVEFSLWIPCSMYVQICFYY